MGNRPSESKGTTDLVVRLDGRGINPREVPIRHLARILEAIQRLADQRDDVDVEFEESIAPVVANQDKALATGFLESPGLKLVGIRTGSAVYKVAAPNPADVLNVIQMAATSIDRPEEADWSNATLSSMKELSEVAKSLHCTIELRHPAAAGDRKSYGAVIATIGPSTYEKVSGSAFVHGQTSVFAKIERVGGVVEKGCGVRVLNQRRMVICRVDSEELVRGLGKHIYREVLLTGEATWYRRNGLLKTLKITGFQPPKTASVFDALEGAYRAGGHAWDKIKDPDKYISETRGA